MITIIDYKAGNFRSIENMLKRLGVESHFTDKVDEIESADRLILPGVGHFDHGMQKLKESGLIEVLNKKVLTGKTPILGICLGAQLMTESSEEGVEPGLGWIKGKTLKFQKLTLPESHKIPHMGWTDLQAAPMKKLTSGLNEDTRFYFVHSFYMSLEEQNQVLFKAKYGHDFHAGFEHENIFGVQFHPEKSHLFGMALLKNFAELK